MATAVKIQLWNGSSYATDVEFDWKEIRNCSIATVNGIEQIQASYSLPKLYDPSKVSAACSGRESWRLDLEIFHHWGTTKAKIESIINNAYKVRVYYQYLEVPGTYKNMIVDPNYSELYLYGYEAMHIITGLVFWGDVA